MEEKIYKLLLTMQQDVSSINTRLDNIENGMVKTMEDIENVRHNTASVNVKLYEVNNKIKRMAQVGI